MNPTKTGLYSTYADDRFIFLYWDGEDWVDQDGIRPCYKKVQWTGPLLSVPALRTWVGLEPEEILDLFDRNNVYGSKWIEFARTVEAKLKERNT
jgi:hypothetical protein